MIQHQFFHPRPIQKHNLHKMRHDEVVVVIKSYCRFCKLAIQIPRLAIMYPTMVILSKFKVVTSGRIREKLTVFHGREVYSESCRTSKMKLFGEIVNDFHPLTISVKNSILDLPSRAPSLAGF